MECRLEWARNSLGKEGDLDFLLNSLHEGLKRHDRAIRVKRVENVSLQQAVHSFPLPF